MVYVAIAPDGRTVRYVDRKRYLWLLTLTGPCFPWLTVLAYRTAGRSPLWLFVPLVYVYVWVPIADAIFGEDRHNPPDEVVSLMARDRYYQALLYLDIALLYANFLVSAWFVGRHAVPWWALVAFALGVGVTSVDALVIGHELGHKHGRSAKIAARLALALVGYGHFRIEHNRGHHVHVATPEDCASARMGESVYRFALRELPGALARGHLLERERLARLGRPALSVHNEILQCAFLTLALATALIAAFGLILVPFIVIHHLFAWYGLTQANYVQHYGLLRGKLADGRYEPPTPRHSWNTNHLYSNLIVFHLQRHSDHHANAARPYQALRDVPDLPRLPSGYPGCFGLAAIPPLWFKIMHPRLMEWAGGDIRKVNVDPVKKERLHALHAVPTQATDAAPW
jgi:alkane 1-monooxygenase